MNRAWFHSSFWSNISKEKKCTEKYVFHQIGVSSTFICYNIGGNIIHLMIKAPCFLMWNNAEWTEVKTWHIISFLSLYFVALLWWFTLLLAPLPPFKIKKQQQKTPKPIKQENKTKNTYSYKDDER